MTLAAAEKEIWRPQSALPIQPALEASKLAGLHRLAGSQWQQRNLGAKKAGPTKNFHVSMSKAEREAEKE